MCGSCSFKMANKQGLSDKPVIVNANAVAQLKTKEIMVCIYSASPAKFKNAFSNVMVNGSPLSDEINSQADVENLALIHDKGLDTQNFGIDVFKVARAVAKTHTPEEIKNTLMTFCILIYF